MNLREYKDRLAKHDWYYGFSEDSRSYNTGLAEQNALEGMAKKKKTYQQAYETEFNKHFKSKTNEKRRKTSKAGNKRMVTGKGS